MKKKSVYTILISFVVLFLTTGLFANNISVSNISLTGQNTGSDYTLVQFNLSWENSWRLSSGPSNWDAAWVFIKYSTDGGNTWNHAKLNNSGHTSPAGSVVQVGLVDEGAAFDNAANPAVGAFIYRDATGSGTLSLSNVQLRWNYGANGVNDTDIVDLRVYAIEMVYVPQSAFYLGTGGSETRPFYTHPTTTNPYLVTSEAAINVGATDGYLNYVANTSSGDGLGPIPAAFPKGYAAFYMMKYELSQQQYVDFLNCLSVADASARFMNSNTYRNGITLSGNTYQTSNPYVPVNVVNSDDYLAFLDWSGLRPFTELEFEKSCRGDQIPVANEYAWGTNSMPVLFEDLYTFSNYGLSNEEIAGNYKTDGIKGNVANSATTGNAGPVRCGIFASNTANSGRVSSGASYYGIMELSGNLQEQTVTAGKPEGRLFTGLHGDGIIIAANHNVSNWPTVSTGLGSGKRGGFFGISTNQHCVSTRIFGAGTTSTRSHSVGIRGSRSNPATAGE